MKNKFIKILSVLFAAVLVASMCVPLCAETKRVTHINSCVLSEDGNTVTVGVTLSDEFLSVYGACGVYLFELPPYAKMADIDSYSPAAELVAQENLTFTLDTAGSSPDRIYNKFVLARMVDGRYQTTANIKYLDNPQIIAENNREYPKYNGTSGVCSDAGLARDTDAARVVLPVALNTLVTDTIEGATKCEYGENVYYIDKENLIALDNSVREFSEKGREVTLQLLLTKPDDNTSSAARKLYRYTSMPEAVYYGVDTSNAESVSIYSALVRFLCERYTRDDAVYGFAGSYIMGANLNSNRTYNSIGNAKDTNYVYELVRALRITSASLLCEYSGAKLYLPFEGNFNSTVYDPAHTENIYLDYSAKTVLDMIFKELSNGSDVPFGIYYDASSSDGRADFWNDENATEGEDSAFVTLKNIETVTNYFKDPSRLYDGYTREVTLSYGISSADERSVAAALCAYYRAKECEDVRALYYNVAEGVDKGALTEALSGLDKKTNDEIKEKIKGLLGDEEYSALVGGTLSSLFVKKTEMPLYQGKISNRSRESTVADFTDNDMNSFVGDSYTSSYSIMIDADNGLSLSAAGNADRAGIYKTLEEYDISKEDVIKIRVLASSESENSIINVVLNGKNESEDVVLTGRTTVKSGEWSEVAFSLSDISTVSYIGISALSQGGEPMTLLCKNIMLYRLPILGVKLVITVIIWIIAIALCLFLVIYIRIVYLKTKKGRKKRKEIAENLKKEEEARKRALSERNARGKGQVNRNTSKKNLERAEKERKEKARREREKAEEKQRTEQREKQKAEAAHRAAERERAEKQRKADAAAVQKKAAKPAEKKKAGGRTAAKPSDIPEMPKTEPKTFMVPEKTDTPVKRKTMSVGIEKSDEPVGEGFDTTSEM